VRGLLQAIDHKALVAFVTNFFTNNFVELPADESIFS